MKKRTRASHKPATIDDWDRQWQRRWSKVGLPGYELPVGGPGAEERDFLAHAWPRAALARLIRQKFKLTSRLPDMGETIEVP